MMSTPQIQGREIAQLVKGLICGYKHMHYIVISQVKSSQT